MVLKSFFQWITLRDYDVAKDQATEAVVKRFSRGNTSVQNGWYMDQSKLDKLSAAGDKAVAYIQKLLPA